MTKSQKTLSPPLTKKEEEVKQLNFNEAIGLMLIGKKIHKLEWKDKNYYGFFDGDILKLHKPDNKLYKWIISKDDAIGTDYIIV